MPEPNAPSPISQEIPKSPDKKPPSLDKKTIGIIAFFALTALLIAGFFLFTRTSHAPTSEETTSSQEGGSAFVSGSVGINGVIPSSATIAIGERKHGSDGQFQIVVTGIQASDGVSYHWDTASHGQPYDMQAYLQVNGNTIASSDIVTLVAPAVSEVFHINIPQSQGSGSSQNQSANISGIVDLNGYIPPGSTIAIAEQASGQSAFTTTITGLSATDGIAWTWDNANAGTAYAIIAYLQVNGNTVSQSNAISVTAPAANEVLVINSTATPPAPATVSVSGSINLNGSIPQGSTISVAARQTGTQTFSIFASNLSASDGVTWNYGNATSGVSYDFQAYLQSNGQTSSTSQVLTVTAPANNEVLTINAQTQPQAPPANSITNECNGKNPSTNLWQVTLGVNNNNVVPGAQQYWVTIGTNQGGNNVYNTIVNANNTGQFQNVQTGFVLTEGQQYYAQYAYSTCQNCNTFSQFSQSLQIYCTTPNTPTPTNTPTNTPVPSSTPVPTNTPVPQPTATLTPTSAPVNTPTPTLLLQN